MKESEPMLETRLYRCGWIFLFIKKRTDNKALV